MFGAPPPTSLHAPPHRQQWPPTRHHQHVPCPPLCSWVNLFQADALVKLVPTVLSCLAMILTLERFSHPLALPSGECACA